MHSSGNQVYIGMHVNTIAEEEYTIQTCLFVSRFLDLCKSFSDSLYCVAGRHMAIDTRPVCSCGATAQLIHVNTQGNRTLSSIAMTILQSIMKWL